MNRTIYLKMKLIAGFTMIHYQSDFEYDKEFMEKCDPKEFIWIVRPNGTHIFRIYEPQDLPKAGEQVPYLFGMADRKHIVRDGLEAIEKINGSIGECDFYYIAPPQGIFRKIQHKEAVEIIRKNVETLEKHWRETA